jgi:nitronate monooxygenase/enoyl-[acyl-carrier protein] reductase II
MQTSLQTKGWQQVLRTPLCDLLGIDVPVIQAPMIQAATARLAAEVSNAGGLGSLSTVMLPADRLRDEIEQLRERTERPFAVNHIMTTFDPEAWDVTLAARPPVISFALGDPGEHVAQAQAIGSIVIQQVVTVASARRAVERGVDVVIAQGSEAGGNSGLVSTLALVPQVVDAVAPVPVVAAGGIADGRGLAAMLMLGAQGVNMGTRFLASREATIPDGWKAAILAAESQHVAKFSPWNAAIPPAEGEYFTIPNVIRTPFVDAADERSAAGQLDVEELRGQLYSAISEGRLHDLTPMAGQSAGLVHDLPGAAAIIERLVAEAEAVLAGAATFVSG